MGRKPSWARDNVLRYLDGSPRVETAMTGQNGEAILQFYWGVSPGGMREEGKTRDRRT